MIDISVVGAGLSRGEQEVIIRRSSSDKEWSIYSSNPATANKLSKLAEKYKRGFRIHQSGLVVNLPLDAIKFKNPKKILTDEEKAVIVNRLRKGSARKGSA